MLAGPQFGRRLPPDAGKSFIWWVIAAGAAPCLENKWYQGWYGDRHLRPPPRLPAHSLEGLQQKKIWSTPGSVANCKRRRGYSPVSPSHSLLQLSRQSTSLVRTGSPVQVWVAAPMICPYSSAGQSNGLLNRRSLVRIQLGVPIICPGSLTDRTYGYGPQDVGSTPARGAKSSRHFKSDARHLLRSMPKGV